MNIKASQINPERYHRETAIFTITFDNVFDVCYYKNTFIELVREMELVISEKEFERDWGYRRYDTVFLRFIEDSGCQSSLKGRFFICVMMEMNEFEKLVQKYKKIIEVGFEDKSIKQL